MQLIRIYLMIWRLRLLRGRYGQTVFADLGKRLVTIRARRHSATGGFKHPSWGKRG